MYTFNLFGDPSLDIRGIILENLPPDKPTIDGPNTGNPGTEYTYCIIASDPDEDTVYVMWDWGDGTISEWFGPLSSGTEVCDSHIWDEKGIYTVSVTVKDEHGLDATAYKDVWMQKSRTINSILPRVFKSIQNAFPNLQYIFR